MVRPYKTDGKEVKYVGNKIFAEIKDILNKKYSVTELENRVHSFDEEPFWEHIAKINDRIFISTTEYFTELKAMFTLLPLTTRMISSPGAVYGKEAINYTTDTCPIKLDWFNHDKKIFLAESSQIYLELSLIQKNISQVYAIYSSFRKEEADATHLSEFHHIEYEGQVNQEENQQIAFEMIKRIINDLVTHNLDSLKIFLVDEDIEELKEIANQKSMKIITLKEALDELYKDTQDEKYKEFTLKHFGSWEEIRITEIYGSLIGIKDFPLLEVPFYHATIEGSEPRIANNLDIIWPGYREILGSGQRIKSEEELKEKSKIFNLPMKDYQPYIQSRQFSNYKPSSGFGMGWERLIQGLLKMPFIWSASQFPRVDKTIKP
ncbi:asparagine--tRNA ligase [Candidatus Woesearchaeota archaeon]|nr:asparagine--tRNA ligase [Candidatus Woesearchaeota archaeon]